MLRMTVDEQHQTMCDQVQKLMQESQVIHGLKSQLAQAKEKIRELKSTIEELDQEKGAYADMLKEQQANVAHYLGEY